MFTDAKRWQEIRHMVLSGAVSKRQAVREEGVSWDLLNKMLAHALPQPYTRKTEPSADSKSNQTQQRPTRKQGDVWQDVLESLANGNAKDARTILSAISAIKPHSAKGEQLNQLRERLGLLGFGVSSHQFQAEASDHNWLLDVMQGNLSKEEIRADTHDEDCLDQLIEMAQGDLRVRNRALAVLAKMKGITLRSTATFLRVGCNTVLSYQQRFREEGIEGILETRRWKHPRKIERKDVRDAVFTVLHSPPREYDFNRTSWKMDDLKACLYDSGVHLSKDSIREIIKSAGYKWRKAKVVLTSPDPTYREKLQQIQSILSSLGNDERFFSIDEFGPFSIKMKGGKRLVGPDEYPYVQQLQKSKGFLIVTAALELSTNQVTHFYSWKKNTVEMLRLLYLLLEENRGIRKLYFSWDAASWHSSKRLNRHVKRVNALEYRRQHDTPEIELAPLPASAQFLNVIESVFSGMAKAIIHNSDYESVQITMDAIDRYFSERNEHFQNNPQRAGNKIWGNELVPVEFAEAHNCKDPRW